MTVVPAPGFEDLASEAHTLESGQPAPGTPGATQIAADLVQQTALELEQALVMARLMVAPMFKWWAGFADTWSDKTLQAIAAGGAAVMVKHGWTLNDLFSTYGPYIALGVATLPPTMVTYAAIKQQRKAQAAQQQAHVRTNEGASHGGDGQAAG